MSKALCIHGHFYQPPRFDPWLDVVPTEGSAAPEHDWNSRITKECYAPLGVARRLDVAGKIVELVNCYAWMSFNFGPTLLRWLERHSPQTYARILDGDRQSVARLGHGNALAQVYHHAIMPLATDLDKGLEIIWAVQDFRTRFGRDPEGMWLAETAVDLPTLEALASAGIRFTILAPRQAQAVRALGAAEFSPVNEDTLDTTRPYMVSLSQGKSMSVFFYDGPLSRAVAFERLLANGESFWNRLANSFTSGLRGIATDGESYGHHYMFGEMALAYVIEQARQGRDGVALTNYAAYLAAHPTTHEVRIHENTSWSCVHGVERWKTHCGCSDGGHADWVQDWRRPLRRSFNYLKYYVDEHFFKGGRALFDDPAQALREYGLVLAGSEELERFLSRHCSQGLAASERTNACRILLMQRLALASFSSCAWFFDDIARIEPLNGLTSARRALDLLVASGGPDVEAGFVRILAEAQSNMREDWDGEALWRDVVTPRRPNLAGLLAYVRGPAAEDGEMDWPGLHLTVSSDGTEIRGHWRYTLENEICRATEDSSLPPGHFSEMAIRCSRQEEDRVFVAACTAARAMLPFLTGFAEGQTRPHGALELLVPGLAWIWVVDGEILPADLTAWIVTWLQANGDVRAALERRIEARGMELLSDLPASQGRIVGLIVRARRAGLAIYWWAMQNFIMTESVRLIPADLNKVLNIAASEI